MARAFSLTARRVRPARAVVVVAIALSTLAAKPKPKPKEPPASPVSELPADLNRASLRVHAVDMLYELDLSSEQLKALRIAADGCASDRDRTPASGNPKLVSAFNDFFRALLNRANDEEIAKLRNHLTELATADDVHLDDDITPTDAARAKAAEVFKHFNAGQVAAFLAAHADMIADPIERMIGELAEVNGDADEADPQIQQTSDDIGWLVAGQDKKPAAVVSRQVSAWFKANRHLSDAELISSRPTLEASAKKVIGDVPAMDILQHFLENQVAELLSNPQLPEAIGAILETETSESK
jgi:hypothetical protein